MKSILVVYNPVVIKQIKMEENNSIAIVHCEIKKVIYVKNEGEMIMGLKSRPKHDKNEGKMIMGLKSRPKEDENDNNESRMIIGLKSGKGKKTGKGKKKKP